MDTCGSGSTPKIDDAWDDGDGMILRSTAHYQRQAKDQKDIVGNRNLIGRNYIFYICVCVCALMTHGDLVELGEATWGKIKDMGST